MPSTSVTRPDMFAGPMDRQRNSAMKSSSGQASWAAAGTALEAASSVSTTAKRAVEHRARKRRRVERIIETPFFNSARFGRVRVGVLGRGTVQATRDAPLRLSSSRISRDAGGASTRPFRRSDRPWRNRQERWLLRCGVAADPLTRERRIRFPDRVTRDPPPRGPVLLARSLPVPPRASSRYLDRGRYRPIPKRARSAGCP